jgi:hypothetical protein
MTAPNVASSKGDKKYQKGSIIAIITVPARAFIGN